MLINHHKYHNVNILSCMKVVYLKITEKIRNRINNNQYMVGSFLPSEKKLAIENHTCVSTVRKALLPLVKEKILQPLQGKGYLVIKKINYKNRPLAGFHKVMENAGEKNVINLVTQFEVIAATTEIADKLAIQTGEPVYSIERLRLLNEIPILLETSFLSVRLFPNLSICHLEVSKFKYIREECNITICDGYRTFLPLLADEYVSKLLQVPIAHPLLEMKTIVFSIDNQPIEISKQILVTERYNTQHYFKA